jgi:hypothetical protein
MKGELQCRGEKSAWPISRYDPGIGWGNERKPRKYSARLAYVPAEIQSAHIMNSNCRQCTSLSQYLEPFQNEENGGNENPGQRFFL